MANFIKKHWIECVVAATIATLFVPPVVDTALRNGLHRPPPDEPANVYSNFEETPPCEGDVAWIVEWKKRDLSTGSRKTWTRILADNLAKEMRVSHITKIQYRQGEWKKVGQPERVLD